VRHGHETGIKRVSRLPVHSQFSFTFTSFPSQKKAFAMAVLDSKTLERKVWLILPVRKRDEDGPAVETTSEAPIAEVPHPLPVDIFSTFNPIIGKLMTVI
jgi:hypothetical protein